MKVGDLPSEERELIELLRRLVTEDRAAVAHLLYALAGGVPPSVH
jgi:hypothetical protein